MDVTFITARTTLVGGALFGILLVLCLIFGRLKNDPSYYKVFLICTPLYVTYMLLYPLPLEAVTQTDIKSAIELQFVDNFFGPKRGIILGFIIAPIFIVAATYHLWIAVKRSHDACHRRSPTRPGKRPLIQRKQYIDDNPYQTISECNTVYV